MWRAGLVAIGLLVLAEGALRFGAGLGDPPLARLDPATEYELVPSGSYRRWGNAIEINSFGMRARDHAPAPPPDERRVLLIGDSVIYGTHFLDQRETIASVAEAALAAAPRLEGCDILALPMAASSWGPENQAAFLAREGRFGATAAVILVSAHDLYDVPGQPADILPYRLVPSRTALGDAARIVLERVRRPSPPATGLPSPDEAAARSLAALGRMVEGLRADGGPDPILAYHPTTAERQGQPAPERDRFRDWARDRGVRFLDLGEAIGATGGYRDGIHPDAAGAARIAGTLAAALAPDLAPCVAGASG